MKVKIKTWERMEKEFGLDKYSDIDCKETFISNMEDSLPKDRIIEIEKDENISNSPSYNIYVWYVNEFEGEWNITDDMIEEIIEE